MPPAYSPALDLAKPTGRKPAAVTSVPVSIGKAVEVQAKVAARLRSHPCSIFTTIISMVMMASSTRSPSATMSAPSVMRCRSMPAAYMMVSTIASTSGTDSATTMPARQPSDRKLTRRTMPSASTKVSTNSETERSTMLGGDRGHGGLEIVAERDQVGAVLHGDAQAQRGLAALAHDEARRVLVAALDGGDVAQPEDAAVHLHRHGRDGIHPGKCPGDPQIDALRRGVHRGARRD